MRANPELMVTIGYICLIMFAAWTVIYVVNRAADSLDEFLREFE